MIVNAGKQYFVIRHKNGLQIFGFAWLESTTTKYVINSFLLVYK